MKSNTKDCLKANAHSAFLTDFRDHFAIDYANNVFLQTLAFRLRHQVYCMDNSFETRRADQLETDRFDTHAEHALLKHLASHHYVGYVRLILPEAGDLKKSLPIFNLCQHLSSDEFPPHTTAEISRFLLSQEMIKGIIVMDHEQTQLRVFSHTLFSLLSAILEMACNHHMTHLCALLDMRMVNFTRKMGLAFKVLGPSIDHHGPRLPCSILTEQLLNYCESQLHG